MNQFLSILFLLVGVGLLAWGVLRLLRQRATIARSLPAEGTIIELQRQRAEGEYVRTPAGEGTQIQPKLLFRPVVQFTTAHGRRVRFVTGVAVRPAPYQVGARVPVLYDPDDPPRAQIDRFLYLWFHVLLLIGFGTFFTAMGLLGYVLSLSA
jgi:hypothetical protein